MVLLAGGSFSKGNLGKLLLKKQRAIRTKLHKILKRRLEICVQAISWIMKAIMANVKNIYKKEYFSGNKSNLEL